MSQRRVHRVRQLVGCAVLVLGMVAPTPAHAAQADYIVFEVDTAGVSRPVFIRRVQLSAPLTATPDHLYEGVAGSLFSPEQPRLAIQVETGTGQPVFRKVVQLPRWTRGEFRGRSQAGGGFAIDTFRVEMERRSFVLRVPVVDGGRLLLSGPGQRVFNLDELRTTSLPSPSSFLVPESGTSPAQATAGDPGNRVDLLIVGDGYTAVQQPLFAEHVNLFRRFFFRGSPYKEYKNHVNVRGLFSPSIQSGADHPPYSPSCAGDLSCCADLEAASDPLAGTYVDTAFNASFCSANIHRLLYVNQSAVLAAASAMPDWDKIIVAVNDATYGGAGGNIMVVSTHDDALEIVRHEYGHGFTNLADEYDTPFPGFPACSDITGPACEANVTDQTGSSLIKWAPWIAPGTPLPTPENSPLYASQVGLFQGARYLVSGMYRPRDESCLMHFLDMPFCEICSQEYILRLYSGGWGDPAGGIDPIEPGLEYPPASATVNGTGGGLLSVTLLQPAYSPLLQEQWFVDGLLQPDQPGRPQGVFEFTPPTNGTYQVEVQVRDTTPLVNPAMSSPQMESARSWQVEVGFADSPGEALALAVEPSPTTPGNLIISWSPGCSPAALDYAIYEGTLGDFTSHSMKDCSDDGTPLAEEITPAAGNTYYLVVPMTLSHEGVYGLSSDGRPRPAATLTCRSGHAIAACP